MTTDAREGVAYGRSERARTRDPRLFRDQTRGSTITLARAGSIVVGLCFAVSALATPVVVDAASCKGSSHAAPLLASGLVEKHGLIIDAKSGVSGAGRSHGPAYHFPEASEGMRPYKVAAHHQGTRGRPPQD